MFCPQELAVAVNALSILIAQGLSPSQMEVVAAIFTQMGDTLVTLAAQQAFLEEEQIRCCSSPKQFHPLP